MEKLGNVPFWMMDDSFVRWLCIDGHVDMFGDVDVMALLREVILRHCASPIKNSDPIL